MQYQLYSKNVFITDSLREYLDEKLGHIDRLSIEPISFHVDISRDAHHRKGDIFRVECNINVPGKFLRIVKQHGDVRAAIDLATDRLLRQIKKYKSQRLGSERKFRGLFRRLRKQ
jgi:putative sigma-54 modulation protein